MKPRAPKAAASPKAAAALQSRPAPTAAPAPNAANASTPGQRRIELPEIFEPVTEAESSRHDDEAPVRNVLFVARSPALKNFLAPVFQREQCRLFVTSTRDETEEILAAHSIDHILVAQDSVDEFSQWVAQGVTVSLGAEVSVLSSVSAQLLDNPAPYSKMIRTVLAAVQAGVDDTLATGDSVAPHALVARDVRDLGKALGLRRLAVDGSQVAVWLLTPTPPPSPLNFDDLPRSLERARLLHFPWRIDAAIERVSELLAGREPLESSGALRNESNLAAQIIALAWYRHCFEEVTAPSDEPADVKGRLRSVAGRLATHDVVEAYIRLIEAGEGAGRASAGGRVVVVTASDDFARDMSTRFGRLAITVERVARTTDARAACERTPTTAVIVDFTSLGMEAAHASVLLRLLPNLRLYASIDSNDPSVTLDLIDTGFDDVITSSRDLDVLVARINRETRRPSPRSAADESPGFRGMFAALSFVDLVQSLAQSRKSVRIDLDRGDGMPAVIYLDAGRLVYARTGSVSGVDAVYDMIAWGDEGRFAVEPASTFPPANVTEATEAILMEGCRRFDESRAAT